MRAVRLIVGILVVACVGQFGGCLTAQLESEDETGESAGAFDDPAPEDQAPVFEPAHVSGNGGASLSNPAPASALLKPPPVACMAVNPEKVNFGGKKYGEQAIAPLEILACGEVPLLIYGIHLKRGPRRTLA